MATKPRETQIDRLNYRLGESGYALAIVPVAELRLLEKNARYMPNEQFRNLVTNIKADGALTSVPFCVKEADGGYSVLSGNHRVMAAKEAGFEEIPVLYTDRPMDKQQRIAVQLSHNAIAGKDDGTILKELFDEIEDVGLKYYSGIDDSILDNILKVNLTPLSEAPQEYRQLSFVFLPEEEERLEAAFEQAFDTVNGEKIYLCRFGDYDRLLDTLEEVKKDAGVKNTATAMMLLLDVFDANKESLKAILNSRYGTEEPT